MDRERWPWPHLETTARGSESGRSPRFHPASFGPEVKRETFSKPAQFPPEYNGPGEQEEEPAPARSFPKPAQPPEPREQSEEPPSIVPRKAIPRAGGGPSANGEKETAALEDFDRRALEIYAYLSTSHVEMDIFRILREYQEDEAWMAQFRSLVRPRRAATGLRYVRLMEKYVSWVKSLPEGEVTAPFDKDVVWRYIHSLTQAGVGRFTPKSVQHAIQYFADAFGAECLVSGYRRIRRMVEAHTQRDVPRVGAPMIPVSVLAFLEDAVTSPKVARGFRVACGKLRLCVQASLRWDDLARTPIRCVEWARRRGEKTVVGLRTRQAGSKTGSRPWVASYL